VGEKKSAENKRKEKKRITPDTEERVKKGKGTYPGSIGKTKGGRKGDIVKNQRKKAR